MLQRTVLCCGGLVLCCPALCYAVAGWCCAALRCAMLWWAGAVLPCNMLCKTSAAILPVVSHPDCFDSTLLFGHTQ